MILSRLNEKPEDWLGLRHLTSSGMTAGQGLDTWPWGYRQLTSASSARPGHLWEDPDWVLDESSPPLGWGLELRWLCWKLSGCLRGFGGGAPDIRLLARPFSKPFSAPHFDILVLFDLTVYQAFGNRFMELYAVSGSENTQLRWNWNPHVGLYPA